MRGLSELRKDKVLFIRRVWATLACPNISTGRQTKLPTKSTNHTSNYYLLT